MLVEILKIIKQTMLSSIVAPFWILAKYAIPYRAKGNSTYIAHFRFRSRNKTFK